jgi:hypothetical protein
MQIGTMDLLAPDRASTMEDCVENIGPRRAAQRLLFGLACFAIGVVMAVVLLAFDAAWPWRFALFLPFVAGAHGYFQARDRTCVGLAARIPARPRRRPGRRHGSGELAQIERQARRVYVKSVASPRDGARVPADSRGALEVGFYEEQILPRWLSMVMGNRRSSPRVRARRMAVSRAPCSRSGSARVSTFRTTVANVSEAVCARSIEGRAPLAKKRTGSRLVSGRAASASRGWSHPLDDASVDAGRDDVDALHDSRSSRRAPRDASRAAPGRPLLLRRARALAGSPTVAKWQHRLDPIEMAIAAAAISRVRSTRS